MKTHVFILSLCIFGSAFGQNKFSGDKELRDIYTFQDQRNTLALLPYLSHEKEKYRLASAMAFASVQDSAAVAPLLNLLSRDRSAEVRKAAAFSLGQLYLASLVKPLIAEYKNERKADVKNALLEAIGKTATKDAIPFLEQLKIKKAIFGHHLL